MRKITYERLFRRARGYRRRNFWFTLVLIAALAVFVLIADQILREFEGTQPQYLVDQIVQGIAGGDYESLYASEDPTLFPEEDKEDYLAFVAGRLGGKELTWRKVASPDQDRLCYRIQVDGADFAALTLRLSEERSPHGFERWEMDSVSTGFVSPVTYTVYAQDTSTVTADGVVLGKESLVKSGLATEYDDHLLEGMPSQKECQYAFTRCFSDPVVAATDFRGRRQTVTREGNAFTVARRYDDEAFQDVVPRVKEVLDAVAEYVVGIRTVGQARAYTVKDSPASNTMYMYSLWTSTTASRAHIEEFVCEDFLSLSEDFFCCHVTADFYCSFRSRDDTLYKLDYEMYFQRVNERWALYDLVTK